MNKYESVIIINPDLEDEQNELINEIHSIEYEQLFMFGYIISKELYIEAKNK